MKNLQFQTEPVPSNPPAPSTAQKTMREMLLEKFPQFDPTWPDEIKTKWFAGFEQLMKAANEK